ncbi:hypothetical protein DXA14_21010 [Hungatella hathewayi]|nr:hypothetical protein DXA14_21010 [Hungatella hathewayi]
MLLHSNSLSNKMDNSLLDVRDINHKYIVVGGIKRMKMNRTNTTSRLLALLLIALMVLSLAPAAQRAETKWTE